MPSYKGHLAGGLCVGAVLLYGARFFYPITAIKAIELLICCLAGSLFPDIDVKSKGQNYFYLGILFVLIFCMINKKYQLCSCISVASLLPLLARHRGLCHRLWFVIGVPLAVWSLCYLYVSPVYARFLWLDILFFIAGAISHLWLDLGLRRMLYQ